jgi:hypothetical protein
MIIYIVLIWNLIKITLNYKFLNKLKIISLFFSYRKEFLLFVWENLKFKNFVKIFYYFMTTNFYLNHLLTF